MKWPLLILALFSMPAALAADCSLWSIRGTVIYESSSFYLLAAQGSLSETKLLIPHSLQQELADAQGKFLEVSVVLKGDTVPTNGTILAVKERKLSVPDPLRDNKSTIFRKKGGVPCP